MHALGLKQAWGSEDFCGADYGASSTWTSLCPVWEVWGVCGRVWGVWTHFRETTLLINQRDQVERFGCQEVQDFLVVHKLNVLPLDALYMWTQCVRTYITLDTIHIITHLCRTQTAQVWRCGEQRTAASSRYSSWCTFVQKSSSQMSQNQRCPTLQ